MRARKAGMIGGSIAVGLALVLGGAFAVTQTLEIGDEAGRAIDVSPVVVGTSADHPPLVVLLNESLDAQVSEVVVEAPAAVEVVTAPEPRQAPPIVVAPPPAAPPEVEAPAPERPAQPQRPSASDMKRWLETGAYDEALTWAKAHGWTEASIRAALREYAPNGESKR